MSPHSISVAAVLFLLLSLRLARADDVYIAFPTCADNIALCKSEKERQESIANRKRRDAAAAEEKARTEATQARRDAEIKSLQLGEARRKEAERFVALKEAAEKARSRPESDHMLKAQKRLEAALIRCHGSLENAKKSNASCQ
nr:hypothetical protein [uncultured Duganella sp.]